MGHLGSAHKIAAIGIGNAVQNCIAISVILGLNGALNTLISQSAGAGNIDLCLVILKRAYFALAICFIPVVLILLFTKEILVGIGQDELVSGYAYEYNLVFTPALFFFGVFDAQRQFLNSLKRNQVIFVI